MRGQPFAYSPWGTEMQTLVQTSSLVDDEGLDMICHLTIQTMFQCEYLCHSMQGIIEFFVKKYILQLLLNN